MIPSWEGYELIGPRQGYILTKIRIEYIEQSMSVSNQGNQDREEAKKPLSQDLSLLPYIVVRTP